MHGVIWNFYQMLAILDIRFIGIDSVLPFYRVRHLTFFFQLVLISWMVTLRSCLIWQIISFILQPNEYGCVYTWTTLRNIATDRFTEDADFGKKIIFSDEAHFDLSGYVNKQSCRIWGTETPTHTLKSRCTQKRITVWVLVQRHNWVIFLRKWARRDRYSQWRSLSGHVKRIFVHKSWRGGYWQYLVSRGRRYVPHSRSYTRCLGPVFEDRIISRWTIICGVLSKISVTPTRQRQLAL